MIGDDSLYIPGSGGLIRFPEQVVWQLDGDKDRADTYRGSALQLKACLDSGNVNNLQQCSATRQYDDGTVIEVRKTYNFYDMSIYCPTVVKEQQEEAPPLVPELKSGQFFWVPGCKARYGFREGNELYNEIPVKKGSVTGDTTNTGNVTSFLSLKEVGLPVPGVSPDSSIARQYRVCQIDGADPDTGYSGSRLEMSSVHIPMDGPFSISCVVRLRKEIQIDYSFSSKTKELDSGYTIYNPIKARFLFSDDGDAWSATCPGSLAPLVGCKIPSRFSDHWVNFTYPWPTYNNNFVSGEEKQIGYREIATVCDGEPLLTSDYSAASPYWDKVPTGELETLSGTFAGGWAENTETANTDPYASYCRFNVPGIHTKDVGTRAVRTLENGEHRYSTVYSCSYDEGAGTTSFVLKDYQFKRYMAESDGGASITFGSQPFPVCHPEGYLVGINLLGLCWYNGNRILAGKICDFQNEYTFAPIVSDPLDIGNWYHVCMTYNNKGEVKLFYTKLSSNTINVKLANQSTGLFKNTTWYEDSPLPIYVGADDWGMSPADDSPTSEYKSIWEFSSSMDIGLLRFYHRALTKAEAQLLTMEVFDGVFVADDFEAAQLIGAGLSPVTV